MSTATTISDSSNARMDRTYKRLGLTLALLILCSLGTVINLWTIRNWGDQLSSVDAYSEANAIRETHEFIDRGLWVHDGLGNVLYGDLYPSVGFAGDPAGRATHVEPSGVYTHYPPGSEYILYASMKLLGTNPVSRLRLVPILAGWLATIYLGLKLRERFGWRTAAVVMGLCLALPISYNAFTSVHLIGYGLPFLMVEMAICFGCNRLLWPFLLLGFVQGWLSFDYVFLATFTPLAIDVALPRLQPGTRTRWHLGLWRVAAAGAGFTLAHLLHFMEVWAFFGSFQAALQDMRNVAANRSGEGTVPGVFAYIAADIQILYIYWMGGIAWPLSLLAPSSGPVATFLIPNLLALRFLGMTLGAWWVLLTSAILVMSSPLAPRESRYCPRILVDWLVVSACGFITCSLWMMAMKNHAWVHRHLLYRHLFLAFLLMVIFVVHRFNDRRAVNRAVGD